MRKIQRSSQGSVYNHGDVEMSEGCTEKCWTPVPCPQCGRSMPPSGRSAPLGSQCLCSEEFQHSKINTRHLWNQHDSTRVFTDELGWAAHITDCKDCFEDYKP